MTAFHAKMNINDTREWSKPDEHGVCHHLETIPAN